MITQEDKNLATECFASSEEGNFHDLVIGFKNGAEWANNRIKEELKNKGFEFDLNGNICTPEEAYERAIRHTEYRKQKLIDKACAWLQDSVYDRYIEMHEDNIEDFRKAMEE